MLSSRSPPNAPSPWYPDLPLSLRVQETPWGFSTGKEGRDPALSFNQSGSSFHSFICWSSPWDFIWGKKKRVWKNKRKKRQVLALLTGSSLLHLLHLSGHGRPESLQQQLHAGQWLYRAEAGTRHLWACVSKMAHGHTSSLDKGKVNTRLSRGWSSTDPSQAKHHSSKPSQEISTTHCTCFCLEPSPAPSSCVGWQQGDAQALCGGDCQGR